MAGYSLNDSFLSQSRVNATSVADESEFFLDNDTKVRIYGPGVIAFDPPNVGDKSLIYSCGIHGNETAPIEMCDSLVEDVLQQRVVLRHRLLVIFGNLPAMDTATRFVEENLNRLFCHAHEQGEPNAEKVRAKFLEDCVKHFYESGPQNNSRYHYDLHTAIRESKNEKFAVYPFLHGKKHDQGQLAFMAACGVKTILLSQSPTTTFSYHSSRLHDAHSFTVELGKVKPFGQNEMTRFAQADHALRQLAVQQDFQPDNQINDMLLYTVNQVVLKTQTDFALHFSDDTPNFTDYAKGTVLATEQGTTYVAQHHGEAIVFPNADVALGQRALLTVVPVNLEEL